MTETAIQSPPESIMMKERRRGSLLQRKRSGGFLQRSHKTTILDVPYGHGLLVTLDSDGSVILTFEPDCHWEHIHPNAFGPQGMEHLQPLKGGGSGTTVFSGSSPELGDIVMKHASHKDLKEVFSLAVIHRELQIRGRLLPKEAQDMLQRIPEFKMIYISPHHLRDRSRELWIKLKHNVHQQAARRRLSFLDRRTKMELFQNMRHIRLCFNEIINESQVQVGRNQVDLILRTEGPPRAEETQIVIPPDTAFQVMSETMKHIIEQVEQHFWKITIGQTKIGTPQAKNGAFVHTKGLLRDKMVANVVNQFIQVIRNLMQLTYQDEKDVVSQIREEVEQLMKYPDPSKVSKAANQFCGSAIAKNFQPDGRFASLYKFGEKFRTQSFELLDESELVPAQHLGRLLTKGATLDLVFLDAPSVVTALEKVEDTWLQLLIDATSCQSTVATDCIWTCGLTDAGLHNMFVSEEEQLWLFDLGEPQYMPIPAFLTKTLMSFYHVFGMEEIESNGGWVVRFDQTPDDRLVLTDETVSLMPYIHEVFEYAINRFVNEVLEGDKNARRLMIKYVLLQLLSDAAFCLGKWQSKGGGEERYSSTRGESLGKWLWRCLWDIYIASEVFDRHCDCLELTTHERHVFN